LLAATDPRLVSKDPSLRSDILHVADAIHAGADYFVTNDGNLNLASQGWNLPGRHIQVVRPHQLIATLVPESFITDFRSHLIDDGDLEWHTVLDVEPEFEPAFRVYEVEKRPNNFTQRLRELLSKRKTTTVQKLTDDKGNLWALAAWELDGTVVRVPLLRSVRGERGSTVAFQLLRHFRRTAWEHGATRLEIADGAVSTTLDAALTADGFGSMTPRTAELGPVTALAASLDLATPAAIGLAERHFWPLVVRESGLTTYLIPIQPRWATSLLGLNDGLFSMRRRGLGLSRELVYFSGSRVEPARLPARVLWYASSDEGTQHAIRSIVARSLMVDAVRLPAEEALSRFGRVGVLRRSEIQAAADTDGKVNVIRFEDTELLDRPISRHHEIFKHYVKGNVQSIRQVDTRMFDEVMALQATHRPVA